MFQPISSNNTSKRIKFLSYYTFILVHKLCNKKKIDITIVITEYPKYISGKVKYLDNLQKKNIFVIFEQLKLN